MTILFTTQPLTPLPVGTSFLRGEDALNERRCKRCIYLRNYLRAFSPFKGEMLIDRGVGTISKHVYS